jgi:hypothetical protein
MKARLALLHGRLVIEAEGVDVKTLFRELGAAAEILETDINCGCCGSADIRPNCRTIDNFDYYALHCNACGAELSFGQRRDGGLFVKRKDEHGKPLPDGGWRRWQQRAVEAPPLFSASRKT